MIMTNGLLSCRDQVCWTCFLNKILYELPFAKLNASMRTREPFIRWNYTLLWELGNHSSIYSLRSDSIGDTNTVNCKYYSTKYWSQVKCKGKECKCLLQKRTRNSSLEINLLEKDRPLGGGCKIFLLFKTFLKYWLISKGNFLILFWTIQKVLHQISIRLYQKP